MKLRYDETRGTVYRDGALVGEVTQERDGVTYWHRSFAKSSIRAFTLEELLPKIREYLNNCK